MEELVFNNYLLNLKSCTEVYVHGSLESSNINVRKVLKKCLEDTMESQSKTYDKMVENGWYTVKNIETKSIQKCLDNLSN